MKNYEYGPIRHRFDRSIKDPFQGQTRAFFGDGTQSFAFQGKPEFKGITFIPINGTIHYFACVDEVDDMDKIEITVNESTEAVEIYNSDIMAKFAGIIYQKKRGSAPGSCNRPKLDPVRVSNGHLYGLELEGYFQDNFSTHAWEIAALMSKFACIKSEGGMREICTIPADIDYHRATTALIADRLGGEMRAGQGKMGMHIHMENSGMTHENQVNLIKITNSEIINPETPNSPASKFWGRLSGRTTHGNGFYSIPYTNMVEALEDNPGHVSKGGFVCRRGKTFEARLWASPFYLQEGGRSNWIQRCLEATSLMRHAAIAGAASRHDYVEYASSDLSVENRDLGREAIALSSE